MNSTYYVQCYCCFARTERDILAHPIKGLDWSRDKRGRPRCPDHPEGGSMGTLGDIVKRIDLTPETEEGKRREAEAKLRLDVTTSLVRVMKQKGLTQEELAARLGVSEPCMNQYFAEGHDFTVATVARLFHALGVECRFHVPRSAKTPNPSNEQGRDQ